jgi:hypothetical protein
MGQTIVVGDVHGCREELERLLRTVHFRADEDELLLVGDLVSKGPDSSGVIALVREVGGVSVLGNHELRLLRYRQTKDADILKPYDPDTLAQLKADDWRFLEEMPKLVQRTWPREILVVHGGILPDVPLADQDVDVCTHLRLIDGKGRPYRGLPGPSCAHWSKRWEGPPHIFYGHTPLDEIDRSPWATNLDTGCVYGGKLTAWVSPGERFVQVPARKVWADR